MPGHGRFLFGAQMSNRIKLAAVEVSFRTSGLLLLHTVCKSAIFFSFIYINLYIPFKNSLASSNFIERNATLY